MRKGTPRLDAMGGVVMVAWATQPLRANIDLRQPPFEKRSNLPPARLRHHETR
jgi:hypothetical protein